jgi:hypothetical protein
MYKWSKPLSLNPLWAYLKTYHGFSAVSQPSAGLSSYRDTAMKPVNCGCGVHTVPVAGAVSGVTVAVLENHTRGIPVKYPKLECVFFYAIGLPLCTYVVNPTEKRGILGSGLGTAFLRTMSL